MQNSHSDGETNKPLSSGSQCLTFPPPKSNIKRQNKEADFPMTLKIIKRFISKNLSKTPRVHLQPSPRALLPLSVYHLHRSAPVNDALPALDVFVVGV